MGSVFRADLAKQRVDLKRRLDGLRRGGGPMQGVGPTIVTDAPAPWPEAVASEIRKIRSRLAEIDHQLRQCNTVNRAGDMRA
jgi:hypothetical protein